MVGSRNCRLHRSLANYLLRRLFRYECPLTSRTFDVSKRGYSEMANNSVLIVDDTPVNLKLVRVLLSRQGFDVRTASTAEEALEVAETFRPRLVLADIQLPGMDGLEMTRRLKSAPQTRDTIVLALTAFAMKGDEEKAFEAGCDGYITKPIDTRSFPALIRQYLSKPNEGKNTSADRTATVSQVGDSREAFLADGVQRSAALIGSLGSTFDAASALAVVHQWAEKAAALGCQEISQYSREL